MPETVEQIPDDVRELAEHVAMAWMGHDTQKAEDALTRDIAEAIMADRSRRPSSEAGKGEALLREALAWYGDGYPDCDRRPVDKGEGTAE